MNTNALSRSVASNVLFFIRAGLWSFIVIAVGVLWPEYRNLTFLLSAWLCAAVVSIVLNLIILRLGEWPSFRRRKFDRSGISSAVRGSLLIWIGALGLIGGSYVDRFVLATYLSLTDVGVATFYTSFSTSILTMITSSTLAVVTPRLIKDADSQNWPLFRSELVKAGHSAALLSSVLAVGVVVALPLIGRLMAKSELSDFSLALTLIMFGCWVRVQAETAFAGLYALHDDRSIWAGNLLFLVPSTLLNVVLIPRFGLIGLGATSLIANILLLAWRRLRLNRAMVLARAGA